MATNSSDNPTAQSVSIEGASTTPTTPAGPSPRRSRSGLARVFGAIPTLMVIGVLLGLGYLGHHWGWKLPRFSELMGEKVNSEAAWCDAHGVPESICVACKADLMPKGELFGWCKEHGVHECVLDHPETAQLAESATVTPADRDRAAQAIGLRPRAKNDPGCKMHLRRIQFPSLAALDKSGVDIALVDRGRVVESIGAAGEIVYDPTRIARLSARAAGTVFRVEKSVGDRVRVGEVLALVDAADIGKAKADLQQAVVQLDFNSKTLERLAALGNAVPGSRIVEAEAARATAEVAVQKAIQALVNLGLTITFDEVRQLSVEALREKLQFLGLPADVASQFDAQTTTSNLIPIYASRDGLVVTRDAVPGDVIETSKTLFTVVDPSQMWLTLNVRIEDAEYLSIGQPISFQPDGTSRQFTGTLTWISTEVDRDTRTVKVRGELPNTDGQLRNETFGAGEIVLRDDPQAILVPSLAVHWEGCCHVVFVRDKDFLKEDSYKVFHTRSVRPGITMGDQTEIIAGLLPGEVVATKGSGVMRAELLKGNLGEG